MSYNDDKRELLKLKQGIIAESETIKEEEPTSDKAHYEVKGARKKFANFFYHYKWHVIIISFFTALIAFMVYTTVIREKGDIRVLMFSEDPDIAFSMYYKTNDIEHALEQYTPDFDKNGYVHVETYCMDMDPNQDYNYYYTSQAKLYSEVSMGTAQIFIADRACLKTILGDQSESSAFEDLSALYPDDPQVVDKYYYKVKGSAFADTAMYVESCPEDMYIVVKNGSFSGYVKSNDAQAENHARAMEVFDNIAKNNKIDNADSD